MSACSASGGKLGRFQHPHRHRRLLAVADPLEQRLSAGGRPHRSGTHGEVAFGGDLPAGVLRGHAGGHGLIGPHRDGRPGIDLRIAGLDRDMAQAGQADFGQPAARFQAAARPAMPQSISRRAGGRPADRDAQLPGRRLRADRTDPRPFR